MTCKCRKQCSRLLAIACFFRLVVLERKAPKFARQWTDQHLVLFAVKKSLALPSIVAVAAARDVRGSLGLRAVHN